jgi:hypothetical protein
MGKKNKKTTQQLNISSGKKCVADDKKETHKK